MIGRWALFERSLASVKRIVAARFQLTDLFLFVASVKVEWEREGKECRLSRLFFEKIIMSNEYIMRSMRISSSIRLTVVHISIVRSFLVIK